MRTPVMAYMGVITFMVASAIASGSVVATLGATLLHVSELVWCVYRLDASPPAGRDTEERAQGVVDGRTALGRGFGSVDLEAHRAGRDAAQVLCAREEVPHRIDVGGDLVSAPEDVLRHRFFLACTKFVQGGY